MPTSKNLREIRPYKSLGIIPQYYISFRLNQLNAFRKHPLGRTKSIKQAVGVLLDEGSLIKAFPKYFIDNKLNPLEGYVLSNLSFLDES